LRSIFLERLELSLIQGTDMDDASPFSENKTKTKNSERQGLKI
jgi:hypothetical protein